MNQKEDDTTENEDEKVCLVASEPILPAGSFCWNSVLLNESNAQESPGRITSLMSLKRSRMKASKSHYSLKIFYFYQIDIIIPFMLSQGSDFR